MARTFIRQDTQVRSSDTYDDTVVPSLANFETNPANIEENLNSSRSMLSHLKDVQAGNWFDVLITPSALETGVQRGVDNLNDALHLIEKKRVLRDVINLTDITVGAGDNFVILGTGELPANTTAALGAVATLGTVIAAHGGSFGTHSLTEVGGPNALNPKNLMEIVDGTTRDPFLSGGNIVWGLLHAESGISDGTTITDTTTTRAQISFVRVNATGDDLEAVPFADIQNGVINYATRERVRLEGLTEADFLKGAVVDTPGSATVVDRQDVYDNQGTTEVEQTTNATLDLNAAGIAWVLRDLVNANLLRVLEGSGGGTSEIQFGLDVDVFNNDAIVNNFASGTSNNTGGTRPVDIGVNDGVVETTAGDLRVIAAAEMLLDDINQTGSTWAQTDGIKLSEDTAEWDAFEVEFGEVSLLNAIVQASNIGGIVKACANVTSTTVADNDVSLGDGNLDATLGDLSGGDFVGDHDIFLNGTLLRSGANAAANNDVYPGTSLASGQLRFEFVIKINDVICVISRA